MQAIVHYVNEEIVNIKKLMNKFMEFSNIVRWNYSKIVVSGAGDYQWEVLNDNGREIQNQLRGHYAHLIKWIRFLTTDMASTQQRNLNVSIQTVQNLIEQNGFLFKMDKDEQLNYAVKSMDLLFDLVSSAYEVTEDYCIMIPDSRTLLANPEFEKWTFEGIEKFKILLLPIIANELDKAPANDEIKNKILDYTKRGNLLDGVKINEKNSIQFAGNLQIEKTLPWLNLNDHYDSIIAAYFEMVKTNPHTRVILVTKDANLAEKAFSLNVTHMKPPALKIDSTPIKSSEPVADIKPAVQPVKPAPSKDKSHKPMPPHADNKPEKPTKVTIPPNIQNQPPAGMKPRPPKPRIKSRLNNNVKPDSKSSRIKTKR
ncbi:PIN domain-containing protein [Sporomusa acidovorans]|uniref:PIN domain-containing protein n=1 Tax=Sporomusa acidovorans (strain ATCC 49682 / DSM 3132 / Mol) TaxID=1123286 RepID=A0ABZ3IYK0_SPOA4|nr:PIN domain-containing protein [Sporomusa acidovorans]OZC17165.1 hypothetical protein SPACI_39380 [Sporomusa acidovorans DSM 3132]SDE81053.1 PIN domain-containing protein [Sporomusa acidovorans]